MFFRSTVIDADPRRIDDGIHFVRDEVVPFVGRFDGNLGVLMLVNRVTGRTVVTTAWGSAPALRDSLDALGVVRSQTARLLGGEARVEQWEVPELHRVRHTEPGMGDRSTRVQVVPADMDLLIDTYRTTSVPALSLVPGFCSTTLMVDRASGIAVSSVTFESRDAMEDSRRQAAEIRRASLEKAHARAIEVLEAQLVVADLRIPDEVA